MKEQIEIRPYPYKEEPKAIETKKPFLPTRAMLKTIEMKLELKRYTKEDICKACGITRQTLIDGNETLIIRIYTWNEAVKF